MHVDKYERWWIIIVVATLSAFLAALVVGAVVFGVRLPEPVDIVNPSQLNEAGFSETGLVHMGDNQYEVRMIARMWSFSPRTITVPEGAVVTFLIASADITHGFIIEHHNVNLQLVPGHIARATVTFDHPGEWHFLCHEYCGRGHQTMHGVVVVEPANADAADA